MKKENKTISIEAMRNNATKVEGLLKQLANAHRLLILCNMVDGAKSVSELTKAVGLSQSALSQHLAKMKDSGIVLSEKQGQSVYYKISSTEVQTILSMLYFMYCK
jgi:DNA-binding transcriptional ArsR family regulator